MGYFQQAVAADSAFGPAYAGLADAYNFLSDYVSPREVLDQMRSAARRAVQLAPNSAEALTALAGVQLWFDWDFAGAEASLRRASDLDPSFARAYLYEAHLLTDLRRHEEALRQSAEAYRLDPFRRRSPVSGTPPSIT